MFSYSKGRKQDILLGTDSRQSSDVRTIAWHCVAVDGAFSACVVMMMMVINDVKLSLSYDVM